MDAVPTADAAPSHDVATTTAPQPPAGPPRPRRWAAWGVGIAAALAAGLAYGVPLVRTALTTVSTDDAYVNSHVTYAAPRITETVVEVLVDDNDHVRKGDLIVVLDRATWRINVGQMEAALGIAQRNEALQHAGARSLAALAKANHFRLVAAMSSVRNQAANLRVASARYDESRAAEQLARIEIDRFRRLLSRGAEAPESVDVRSADFLQAQARTRQALNEVRSLRVALEIPDEPPQGKPLDDVPEGIEKRHSTVISALSAFAQNLADLGLDLPRYDEPPDDYIARIHAKAPNGDLDRLIEETAANAPAVESARAQVRRAEEDVALARLNLSYCEIRSDIDGFVSNRNVNPGNRVGQGQRLMAIRSSTEVWVDCDFKETQLDPIRIGQPVDLHLDAYPGRVFRGRVSGFSPGTGQSLAVLPAQNATGNFVKIVQRLPVRVELVGGNPAETPLFIGLSVAPYVRVREAPEGPNAGQRLRANAPTPRTIDPTPPGPTTATRPGPADVRLPPGRPANAGAR